MTTLVSAAAPIVHGSQFVLSGRSGLVLGAGIVLVLLWLRAKARFHARRFSRLSSRAMSGPVRSQSRSMGSPRMVARASRSRQASRQFRKAVFVSVLLAVAWVWVDVHSRTH
jgi:hypothetical protein